MVAVLCIAAILIVAVIYGSFDPARTPWFPKCLFLSLTGWKCAGCGSQRALYQLIHGHLRAAFEYNALLISSIPLILFVFTAEALRERCPVLYKISRNPAIPILVIVATIAWWILRNIYGW